MAFGTVQTVGVPKIFLWDEERVLLETNLNVVLAVRIFSLQLLSANADVVITGTYWHRHRRHMAMEYNASSKYHLNKIKEAELARTVARRKGGAAALRAQNASTTAAGDDAETASSPPNENNAEPQPQPAQPPAVPASGADTATSPGSSTSSDSESPLAQKISKVNGSNHATSTPPAPPASFGPATTQPSQPVNQSAPLSITASASLIHAPCLLPEPTVNPTTFALIRAFCLLPNLHRSPWTFQSATSQRARSKDGIVLSVSPTATSSGLLGFWARPNTSATTFILFIIHAEILVSLAIDPES